LKVINIYSTKYIEQNELCFASKKQIYKMPKSFGIDAFIPNDMHENEKKLRDRTAFAQLYGLNPNLFNINEY